MAIFAPGYTYENFKFSEYLEVNKKFWEGINTKLLDTGIIENIYDINSISTYVTNIYF